MVPAEARHVTATDVLSPASVRPKAVNCLICEGTSVMASGETITCTRRALGPTGATILAGFSHAATVAVARSRAAHRIRARRWDSLNVNGICVALLQQLGQKKRPPVRLASLRWRPGGLSDLVALVPWLCVTVFRRLCSEQHQLFLRGLAAPAPPGDRKSTRLNSSHTVISYAVFCLKKK